MTVSINGSTGLVFNDGSSQATAATGFGFKNRLINGNMVIDQRNAGASYTITGDQQYGLDRWKARTFGGTGRFSMQQVSDAPAGFTYSNKLTVTTTDTSGTYGYSLSQDIEGYNIADFDFGSSSATEFTFSFWVKSSLTGTYTASSRTNSSTGSCVQTYTINSANTWERKTITFPANTLYTTNETNLGGLILDFGLGAQTSKSTATLGSWIAGNFAFTSGQVDWINTSGATFYITGVQLEKGSTATSFDYRPYGTEFLLCQRYFQRIDGFSAMGGSGTTTTAYGTTLFPVTMRASPSVSGSAVIKMTDTAADYTQSSTFVQIMLGTRVSSTGFEYQLSNFTGLTALRPLFSVPNETGAFLLSAEL